MIITAHVMVKNEYKFLWYSVMSVINHVDRVRLWDTGSSDGTIDIINELLKTKVGKKKILFESHPIPPFDEQRLRQEMLDATEINEKMHTPKTFSEVRGEMLSATTADWFLIVDGDEVWYEDSIKKVTDEIRKNGSKYESLVVPTINTVGDIFHYQEEKAGLYKLAGKVGHYNLRGVNRLIPGLHSEGAHGIWGWADESGKQIQERDQKKILYLDAPYLHCTFLERAKSSDFSKSVHKRSFKRKHEIGLSFPLDYYYPEVFFRPRPAIVPSVWDKMSSTFRTRSAFETPLRKIKRRVLKPQVGY